MSSAVLVGERILPREDEPEVLAEDAQPHGERELPVRQRISTSQKEQPIGILAAMKEELGALIAQIEDRDIESIGNRYFITGRLAGREVVAAIARIGKVASATTATLMIDNFRPGAVLFTGTAGALSPELSVGDIVVAREALQHDISPTPISQAHEVPGLAVSRFPMNPIWTLRSVMAAQEFARTQPDGEPKVTTGLIVTGDQFVSSSSTKAELLSRLPDAMAVEMEGGAVAQVCYEFNVPLAIIRVISDSGDETANERFNDTLGNVAASYSAGIIPRVLDPSRATSDY